MKGTINALRVIGTVVDHQGQRVTKKSKSSRQVSLGRLTFHTSAFHLTLASEKHSYQFFSVDKIKQDLNVMILVLF